MPEIRPIIQERAREILATIYREDLMTKSANRLLGGSVRPGNKVTERTALRAIERALIETPALEGEGVERVARALGPFMRVPAHPSLRKDDAQEAARAAITALGDDGREEERVAVVNWLMTHQFGDDGLDDASITLASFIEHGEHLKSTSHPDLMRDKG